MTAVTPDRTVERLYVIELENLVSDENVAKCSMCGDGATWRLILPCRCEWLLCDTHREVEQCGARQLVVMGRGGKCMKCGAYVNPANITWRAV